MDNYFKGHTNFNYMVPYFRQRKHKQKLKQRFLKSQPYKIVYNGSYEEFMAHNRPDNEFTYGPRKGAISWRERYWARSSRSRRKKKAKEISNTKIRQTTKAALKKVLLEEDYDELDTKLFNKRSDMEKLTDYFWYECW